MENKNSNQECFDLCRKCADECTSNAQICKEEGRDECARLCTECATACNKVVAEGQTNSEVFQKCADACNACATECEKQDNLNCTHCSEVCHRCEEECNSMAS